MAAAHPIHKLPPEVLAEIFTSYCSLSDSDSFAVTLGRGRVFTRPQVLAGTCSGWRQILCSRSAFWCSFDLQFESTIAPEVSDLLTTYIHRSGTSAMLRLNIACPDLPPKPIDSDDPPIDTRLAVLDLLFDKSSRWNDVYIDIGPNVFAHAVFRLTLREKPVDGYFPRLERLDCQDQDSTYFDYRDEHSDSGRTLFHIFQPCPRLHSLSAHDSWKDDPLDYQSLTSLDLMYYRGHSLSRLLSRSPHLRHFSIGWCSIPVEGDFDYNDRFETSSNSDLCYYPNITKLSLPMYDDHFGHGIWGDIRFPSLNALDVDQVEHSGEGITELLTMLSRSECTLHVLNVGKMRPTILARFLSIAPQLQSLKLMFQYTLHAWEEVGDHIFSPLIHRASLNPVPELTSLTIEFHNASFQGEQTTDVAQHFHDMVVSRQALYQSVELQMFEQSRTRSTLLQVEDVSRFFRARFDDKTADDFRFLLTMKK